MNFYFRSLDRDIYLYELIINKLDYDCVRESVG